MTRWPLAVLLDLAARDEAAARRALSFALASEARRREERVIAAAVLRDHRDREADASGRGRWTGTRAASLQGSALHLARLRTEATLLGEELRGRDAAVAETHGEVEARRGALAAARIAVRALERHRETWRAARRRAHARAEDSAMDELVNARPRAGP